MLRDNGADLNGSVDANNQNVVNQNIGQNLNQNGLNHQATVVNHQGTNQNIGQNQGQANGQGYPNGVGNIGNIGNIYGDEQVIYLWG